MKLTRFGQRGFEKPGILTSSGVRRDCSKLFEDWNNAFFKSGGLKKLSAMTKELDSLPDVPESERWAAPIARSYKANAVGLNYSDHAAESGMAILTERIIFQKTTNTEADTCDR